MVTENDISLIMTRIFNKLDSFEVKIDKICDRLTRLEESVKDHYEDIKVEEDRKAARENRKERKYYIIIAAMGISFGLFEIIQNI
jgi:predicted ATP-grasp superfamily ATP-dependent carboligase